MGKYLETLKEKRENAKRDMNRFDSRDIAHKLLYAQVLAYTDCIILYEKEEE